MVKIEEASAGVDLSETKEVNETEETEKPISNSYELKYVGENYKLSLTLGEIIEILNYDNETKQFNQPSDTNVQINYIPDENKLVITGKEYDNVQIEYMKQFPAIGPNDLGTELTNYKILTAKAIKKIN